MVALKTMQKISLKDNKDISEKKIQEYIFDNSSILGLGDLTPITKEKTQPSGGRLDLLMIDDSNTRYEIELQLGATDPSHIVRTIEYWDTERKRYPQYDHCAVIIAEDITGRFQNVINLFNGSIPIIAMQVAAYKTESGDLALIFTKIMDRLTIGTDEEEVSEPADRNYWKNRVSDKVLKLMDDIFEEIGETKEGYELKYNKYYVGLAKDGIAKNFFRFKLKKSFLWLCIKVNRNQVIEDILDSKGIDVNYHSSWGEYSIKINKLQEFKENKDKIITLLTEAKSRVE